MYLQRRACRRVVMNPVAADVALWLKDAKLQTFWRELPRLVITFNQLYWVDVLNALTICTTQLKILVYFIRITMNCTCPLTRLVLTTYRPENRYFYNGNYSVRGSERYFKILLFLKKNENLSRAPASSFDSRSSQWSFQAVTEWSLLENEAPNEGGGKY